jgi:hypothetical protein
VIHRSGYDSFGISTLPELQEADWWYYLGDTLESRGNKLETVDAFMSCANLRG